MFTEHCSGRRGTVNTRLFEGTCEIWFFHQICVHKMWLGSDLYLYFIHTFCKDCNWMFHSVMLLSLFYFTCFTSNFEMLQNVLPALPMSHPFWTMISRSAKNQCLEEFSHWKLVCREVLSYWNEMQAAPIAHYYTLL